MPITKKIVFQDAAGKVFINTISEEFIKQNLGKTEDEILDLIQSKDIPTGIPPVDIKRIPVAQLPKSGVFGAAFKLIGSSVVIDMPKARIIHMTRIRVERNKELDRLDMESLKNIEQKTDNTQVAADKQVLRDLPTTFNLEILTTPEALNAAWPPGLPRK